MPGEEKEGGCGWRVRGGGGHLIVDEYVKQPRGSPQGNTRAKRASGNFAALCLPLESEMEAKKERKIGGRPSDHREGVDQQGHLQQ